MKRLLKVLDKAVLHLIGPVPPGTKIGKLWGIAIGAHPSSARASMKNHMSASLSLVLAVVAVTATTAGAAAITPPNAPRVRLMITDLNAPAAEGCSTVNDLTHGQTPIFHQLRRALPDRRVTGEPSATLAEPRLVEVGCLLEGAADLDIYNGSITVQLTATRTWPDGYDRFPLQGDKASVEIIRLVVQKAQCAVALRVGQEPITCSAADGVAWAVSAVVIPAPTR